jgi:hypothetical protein
MISLNHDDATITADKWRTLSSLMLGLPLLFGLNLFAVKKFKDNLIKRLGCSLVGIATLVIFYYSLKTTSKNVFLIKYIIFSFSAHLFASVCYYYEKQETKGFWQFNRIIFIRFLLSSLYSGVLFSGLVLILASIKFLFKLEIPNRCFADAFYICICFFHVPLFLAGIPSDLDGLNKSNDYPEGLKSFAQYLLIPLITVYIVILYIYGATILFSWTLPKGQISLMIIMMSVLGILNLLLIHPKTHDKENKWMSTYSRFFYAALIPLLILLYVSIFKRIGDYGITESRYYVLFIALWITAISVYFIGSKKKDIRVIPASLLLCSILSTFGPWGATQVTISSQLSRIDKFLSENKIVVDGIVQKENFDISSADFRPHESSMRYLVKHFGSDVFPKWKDSKGNMIQPLSDLKDIVYFLGLSKLNPRLRNTKFNDESYSNSYSSYTIDDNGLVYDIQKYDHLFKFSSNTKKIGTISEGKAVQANIDFKGKKLKFIISNFKPFEIDIIKLTKRINKLRKVNAIYSSKVPSQYLTFTHENNDYKLKVVLQSLSGRGEEEHFDAHNHQGFLLFTYK